MNKRSVSKNYLFCFIVYFFSIGCQISGSFKGLRSYRAEIEQNNSSLISLANYECNKNENRIYIVRAKQLLDCLRVCDSSLVYIWKPNCISKKCIDINALQNLCSKKRVNLFIVAEYYDLKKMSQKYKIEYPILGIDTKYYHSDFTKKYLARFIFELTKEKISNERTVGYFFYQDRLVDRSKDIIGLLENN
jgi:hypothetical protein